MLIDCGRVEDAMSLEIDAVQYGTVYSYPYIVDCHEIPAGEHTLKITVYNAPANRDRMYGLPAGLYGPVKLQHAEG